MGSFDQITDRVKRQPCKFTHSSIVIHLGVTEIILMIFPNHDMPCLINTKLRDCLVI